MRYQALEAAEFFFAQEDSQASARLAIAINGQKARRFFTVFRLGVDLCLALFPDQICSSIPRLLKTIGAPAFYAAGLAGTVTRRGRKFNGTNSLNHACDEHLHGMLFHKCALSGLANLSWTRYLRQMFTFDDRAMVSDQKRGV
jgi:hypothetical protein